MLDKAIVVKLMMKYVRLIIIGVILVFSPSTNSMGKEGNVVYSLGPEDVIKISVWQHPEFSEEIIVDGGGNITLPLLGDIKVEGMTREELEKELTVIIREYVYKPEVRVSIIEYKSKWIYVLGEVRAPGKYALNKEQVTLSEMLYRAGLPTPTAALQRVRIIPSNKTKQIKIIDVHKILYKGQLEKDIVLQPSDTVYVPATISTKISRFLGDITAPISRFLFFDALFGGD